MSFQRSSVQSRLKEQVRRVSNLKKKILRSAFGKKHVKLIMSDGRSPFSHSSLFLYGDSVGDYMKRFFFPIGKYFTENP